MYRYSRQNFKPQLFFSKNIGREYSSTNTNTLLQATVKIMWIYSTLSQYEAWNIYTHTHTHTISEDENKKVGHMFL